jgi:uncharacterized protein YbaR (Trm112 family)
VHIDLIETLRCPRPHEESWLVATFDRMVGRRIADGTLGCPICHASYPIVGGIARLEDDGPPARAAAGTSGARPRPADGGDAPLRLAALLALAEGGGLAVLSGTWAREAAGVAELVPDVHLLLLDPVGWDRPLEESAETISVVVAGGRLPIAAAAARGVALDARHADAAMLGTASRALRDGGRLVAPAASRLPEGISELVRDASVWVGERRAAPRLVPLGRAGR